MCFLDIAEEEEAWSPFSYSFCSLYIFMEELRPLMLRAINEQLCWFYFAVVVCEYLCFHLMIWEYLFLAFLEDGDGKVWLTSSDLNFSITTFYRAGFADTD